MGNYWEGVEGLRRDFVQSHEEGKQTFNFFSFYF